MKNMEKKHQKIWRRCQAILEHAIPLLPSKTLKGYVKGHFENAEKHKELLQTNPLPFYLLDTPVLRARAQQFMSAFSKVLPDTGYYYAVKSNNHPKVAETLIQSGFGLDVSSGAELEMAIGLGAENVVFSGPGKTGSELALAVDNAHCVTVLMDSFSELDRLQKIAAAKNVQIRTGVRLTTMPRGLWKKFGILPEDVPDFIKTANRCSHIQLCGLQFHTSWNMSPTAQTRFVRKLGRALSNLPKSHRGQLSFIDIGGGYWPEQGEWLRHEGTPAGILEKAVSLSMGKRNHHYCVPSTPIETFAQTLGKAILKYFDPVFPCRICFEPGRWISHHAMHLFISVVDKKAPDLVICDAGTNIVGWERYETDYCPILNISNPSLTEKGCHILGSLCTPHDVWGASYFGSKIAPGDILMIPDQGAYTYSLRQEFIKPLPKVVVV